MKPIVADMAPTADPGRWTVTSQLGESTFETIAAAAGYACLIARSDRPTTVVGDDAQYLVILCDPDVEIASLRRLT